MPLRLPAGRGPGDADPAAASSTGSSAARTCGNPCQLCAKECEIQAIHPDGRINANECHYCLDCQMTWHNENKCPPLINKRKKRGKATVSDPQLIPVVQVNPAP